MRFVNRALLAVALVFPSAMAVSAETDTQKDQRPPETLGYVEWVVMQDTSLRKGPAGYWRKNLITTRRKHRTL